MNYQTISPEERAQKWKEIQELARQVLEENDNHDIRFTTEAIKEMEVYKGWQGTMKPSFI